MTLRDCSTRTMESALSAGEGDVVTPCANIATTQNQITKSVIVRDATVVEQLVSYANTAKTLEWYMKLLQPAKPNRRQRIKPVIAQTATGAEQWSI